MRLGDEFIKTFNELETMLRRKVGQEAHKSFYQLVKLAAKRDPVVRRHQDILKSLGDLRNAIVHDREYPSQILADPRPETVDRLKTLLEAIVKPQRLIPRFQKQIRVFGRDESLTDCLMYMEQKDYSQVVVLDGDRHRLLSSEGIVGWLRSARDIGLADLQEATVGDVLTFEDEKACLYLSRNDAVETAIEAFEEAICRGIPRLQAIIVTESGSPSERPFGLITPWDLLGLVGQHELA